MNSITDETRQLTRHTRTAKVWIQMILDHVVVQTLLFTHTFFLTDEFSDEYRVLAIVTFLLMTIIYHLVGVYAHERARSDYLAALLQSWGTLILILGMFGFVTKTSEDFSREVILTWAATGFIGQYLVYLLARQVITHAITETIPTLIIGSGSLGQHIATHINNNQWIPDHIAGVIDDNPDLVDKWREINIPYLGNLNELDRIIRENRIRRVYIAIPMTATQQIKELSLQLIDTNIDVIWAPDIFDVSLLNYSIKEMAGVPLISLSETPLLGASALAKTCMDKTIGIIALIILSPLMLLTAVAVKLSSPGPIIFKQKRHGWDGRILEVWKFRSMKIHTEESGQITQAQKDDDRLTPIGALIRSTSIDELPQLFNVLGGSMSLVGPRPHAIAHNDFYKEEINAYMLRHRIKPGLTGLAQINGYRGETDTVDKMENRVKYDLAYINNWSLWLDLEILYRTVFVLFSKNAY